MSDFGTSFRSPYSGLTLDEMLLAPVSGLLGVDEAAAASLSEAGIQTERVLKGDKPADLPVEKPAIPSGKETVSLRIDRDVLEFFQAGGPGWQDRLNAALRKAAGK